MEIKIQNLVHVEWSDQRVLTSAQVAEYFGTTARNIQRNFQRNRNQFTEGEDFFMLTGDELSQFKNWATNCRLVEPRAKALTLWTEWGVLLLVKTINSDEAWAMYKNLVKFYFRYRDVVVAQPVQTVEKSAALSAAQLAPACVYVVLLQNTNGEFVKIGHSGKIRNRVTAVKRQTKSTTKDLYVTPFMPRKAARLLEWLCQEKFSSRRIEGEFFSVDFEKVCAAVDMFTKVVLTMPLDEDFEKLKSQVKLLTDAVEDFATLDYRADLLAGENIFCRTIE